MCFRTLKALIISFFFINNVENQKGKVPEETLAGSNSDTLKTTLTGLRNCKMNLPLFKVLEKRLVIPFCEIMKRFFRIDQYTKMSYFS